jgi:hypothetical protein
MAIRPFVFLLHRLPPLAPDVREVDEVVWVPVQSLLDPQNNSTFIYHYQDTPIELPCVRFKQYTIWGLTYHMLRELLSRLSAEQAQP